MRSGSEALWIQWQDVDLEDGFLWIESGRNGHRTKSGRSAYDAEAARGDAPALRRLPHTDIRRRAQPVRLPPHAYPPPAGGGADPFLPQELRAAVGKADLPPGFTQHGLSHRGVTTWVAEGKNVVLAKEAVGHAHLATTISSTHLTREHLRSLVEEPTNAPEPRAWEAV